MVLPGQIWADLHLHIDYGTTAQLLDPMLPDSFCTLQIKSQLVTRIEAWHMTAGYDF